MRDAGLLPRVRECAESVLAADAAAVDLLIARWLADGERYGDA
jgi:hypothetical protein